MQGAVATEKEESADDEAGADLRPGGPQALGKAPRQKNQAGDEVPDSGGVERGDGLHGVADGEIRGAPDQVDREKGKEHHGAIQAGARHGRAGCKFRYDGC